MNPPASFDSERAKLARVRPSWRSTALAMLRVFVGYPTIYAATLWPLWLNLCFFGPSLGHDDTASAWVLNLTVGSILGGAVLFLIAGLCHGLYNHTTTVASNIETRRAKQIAAAKARHAQGGALSISEQEEPHSR